MSKAHHPTQLLLKDLIALKHEAQIFMLPQTGKKAEMGFGSTYSPFKSHGLDFQEVRVYQPGDDIRQIDWHVTAKYGKPFTKLYTEEKERTIFFVVDLRENMHFATHGDFKHVIAARLATFMAFIAEHQHDKIGYLILTENGLVSSGDLHEADLVTPFLNALTNPKAMGKDPSFSMALRQLNALLPTGSFLFIFSDFCDWTADTASSLAPLTEKSTVLLVSIYDMLESILPNDSLPFSNGHDNLVIPANNDKMRQKYHEEWLQKMSLLEAEAQKYGWGFLSIKTDEDYIKKLSHFCFQGVIS